VEFIGNGVTIQLFFAKKREQSSPQLEEK